MINFWPDEILHDILFWHNFNYLYEVVVPFLIDSDFFVHMRKHLIWIVFLFHLTLTLENHSHGFDALIDVWLAAIGTQIITHHATQC